jgi:hypothetical protein
VPPFAGTWPSAGKLIEPIKYKYKGAIGEESLEVDDIVVLWAEEVLQLRTKELQRPGSLPPL